MAIEKGRKPNTWLITFNLPEKDANGRYKRAPKRTVHGLKSDAKKELARYRLEYEDGQVAGSKDTVASYSSRFHAQHKLNSPLAYDREALEIKKIERLFRGMALTSLTPSRIRNAYSAERARRAVWTEDCGDERPLSENGLYKVHVKLRQVLKQAYRDGEIPNSPADMVDFPKPPQENKRNSLTLSEARRFRKAVLRKIETEGDAKYVGVLIILGTGCRRGEMLGLSWGDVDFSNNTITFYNQYAKDKVLRNPKMGSAGRRVCMDDTLARILAIWKNSQRLDLEHINDLRQKHSIEPLTQDERMPVINGKYGQRIDPDGFDKFFRNFCVDNGWGEYTIGVVTKTYGGRTFTRGKGYQGLTVHELRHTVASLLVAEGLDVKTVQAQLGHKSASTTLNIYAHAFEERSRVAGDTIGRLLNG